MNYFFNKIAAVRLSATLLTLVLIASCAWSGDRAVRRLQPSYVSNTAVATRAKDGFKAMGAGVTAKKSTHPGFELLSTLPNQRPRLSQQSGLGARFSSQRKIEFNANALPFRVFVQRVFADILGVNYVLDERSVSKVAPVSLSLQQRVTPRQLFNLLQRTLAERGYTVTFKENVYYVIRASSKGDAVAMAVGVGTAASDVPETNTKILQIVALHYGMTQNLSNLLKQMAGVRVYLDHRQSLMYLNGNRAQIIRAQQLVRLVDRPSATGRHIGLIELTYMTPDNFIKRTTMLLKSEGISTATPGVGGSGVVFVPVKTSASVVVFATSASFLQRVKFWAAKIDRPLKSNERQYYIYQPKFARATDLGSSIASIIGVSYTAPRDRASAQGSNGNSDKSTGSTPPEPRVPRRGSNRASGAASGADNGKIRMNVDERSNVLLFYTSGAQYQRIVPLLQRLDVIPKQILLDVSIAEVTLKDEFKAGVEFALQRNKSNFSTLNAFGLGSGLTYSWLNGADQVQLSLFQDNSLVNIISKPTLLIRDGTTASISVGTDIPVVGQTTVDPINGQRQTTSIQYRKTGVQLTVTPTLNSQGVIIMEINQKISNTVDSGVSTAGSPSIFERTISTEVVARNGQTVVLGGLISENTTRGTSKVPLLGDIPWLGRLFRGDSDKKDKTELVVLVTPRIISDGAEWQALMQQFDNQLTNLRLPGTK